MLEMDKDVYLNNPFVQRKENQQICKKKNGVEFSQPKTKKSTK